jgi:hypothetical protein
MQRLTEYIIDTQGLMPPEEVMANRLVWGWFKNSPLIFTIGKTKDTQFRDVDGKGERFKFLNTVIELFRDGRIYLAGTIELYVVSEKEADLIQILFE